MSLRLSHSIALPMAAKPGDIGNADLHHASARMFVARPTNDAVDVVDTIFGVYLYSVPELRGVAAVVAGQALNEVFAADANENKIGFFQVVDRSAEKMVVGRRPSALAWAARRGVLWVANLGHPVQLADCTLSVVDFVTQTRVTASVPLPGRPSALLYDESADTLYVSLDDPARLLLVSGPVPSAAAAIWTLPGANILSMQLDPHERCLLCIRANGSLLALEQGSGKLLASSDLAGGPGSMVLHAQLRRVYVAHGECGCVTVHDAATFQSIETIQTEVGAQTLYLDGPSSMLYVFCPLSSRALVYRIT